MKVLFRFFLMQFIFSADGDGSFMGGGGGAGDGGGDGSGSGAGSEGDEGGTGGSGNDDGPSDSKGGDISYAYPEGLDPSFHGNPTLLKYANAEGQFNQAEIAKALIHANSAIGSDKMLVPNKNFTDEQWSETFQKLGLPKDLDKYEVVNNLPEGMKGNDEMLSGYKELAHKLGVLPAQAQGILDFYNKTSIEQSSIQERSYTDQLADDQNKLKQEWGNGFEKNMNIAEQALNHFYPDPEAKQALIATGFLDTLEGTKFFQRLGVSLGEESFGDEGGGNFGATTQELDDQIASTHGELYKMGKGHPQYQSKLRDYNSLLSKRHGNKPVVGSR